MDTKAFKEHLIKVFHDTYNGSVNIGEIMIGKSEKPCNVLPKDLPIDLAPVIDTDKPLSEDILSTVRYDFSGFGFSAFENKTAMGIGTGLGTLLGLSYAYWDYNDEKRKALRDGEELPDKKKIIIRDTLIGAGLGLVGGTILVDSAMKALNDRKASKESKKTYDKLLENISRSSDKSKMRVLLDEQKKSLTDTQYSFLNKLVSSMASNNRTSVTISNRPYGNNNSSIKKNIQEITEDVNNIFVDRTDIANKLKNLRDKIH